MKNSSPTLFEGMTETEYKNLLDGLKATSEKFKKGRIFYTFEETNDLIGYVTEGVVKIVKTDEGGENIIMERLRKNSIFGERISSACIGGDYVVAIAETDCTVLFFPYSNLSLMSTFDSVLSNKFLSNLFGVMCAKTTNLCAKIGVVSNRTIRDKLLAYFKMAAIRHDSNTFTLDMSLTALAEYLCVDRSAMMRELKKLKEDNVIEIKDKKLTICE